MRCTPHLLSLINSLSFLSRIINFNDVPLNPKEQKFVTGSASKGIAISGYYKSCGNVSLIGDYNYTVSHHFDHWILFNSEGVLCVEPQCGAVNGLNIADGHLLLKPNEMLNLWTKIERRK